MNQLVMLKVLCVEEGMMEMVVEKKWRTVGGKEKGATAKAQTFEGPTASIMKNVAHIETSSVPLKSETHMVLPYRPYAKHIHPRCSGDGKMIMFQLEGSMLYYVPTPAEFDMDTETAVQHDQDSRFKLYFKLERGEEEAIESGSAPSEMIGEGGMHPETHAPHGDLWFCTSLQSSNKIPLLRCENVSSGITEDIPLDRLLCAVRKCNDLGIGPYAELMARHVAEEEEAMMGHKGGKGKSPQMAPSGPAKNKLPQKKHGKADASLDRDNIHTEYPILQAHH